MCTARHGGTGPTESRPAASAPSPPSCPARFPLRPYCHSAASSGSGYQCNQEIRTQSIVRVRVRVHRGSVILTACHNHRGRLPGRPVTCAVPARRNSTDTRLMKRGNGDRPDTPLLGLGVAPSDAKRGSGSSRLVSRQAVRTSTRANAWFRLRWARPRPVCCSVIRAASSSMPHARLRQAALARSAQRHKRHRGSGLWAGPMHALGRVLVAVVGVSCSAERLAHAAWGILLRLPAALPGLSGVWRYLLWCLIRAAEPGPRRYRVWAPLAKLARPAHWASIVVPLRAGCTPSWSRSRLIFGWTRCDAPRPSCPAAHTRRLPESLVCMPAAAARRASGDKRRRCVHGVLLPTLPAGLSRSHD